MPTNTIDKATFERLARAADKDNCLMGRQGKHGLEAAIFLNGHKMADAIPDENGDYTYRTYF